MNLVKSALATAALLAATGANATVIQGNSLQTIINGLYACGVCSQVSQAPNVLTDQAAPDEQWAIEASGSSIATIVLELAGLANDNIFGVYDVYDPSKRVQLFGGPDSSGDSVALSFNSSGTVLRNFASTGVKFAGSHFGYYLQTPDNLFYSQHLLNPGGADQMVAFRGDGDSIQLPDKWPGVWGPSSYILAWEDLRYSSSDQDFDDFVVYVESVTAVPEPNTLALFGLGLLGLGVAGLRKRTRAVSR